MVLFSHEVKMNRRVYPTTQELVAMENKAIRVTTMSKSDQTKVNRKERFKCYGKKRKKITNSIPNGNGRAKHLKRPKKCKKI